jgi:hypothetical protein
MKITAAIRRAAGCLGKERFESFTRAQEVAHQVSRRRSARVTAYHCTLCGGSHVGSTVRKRVNIKLKRLRYQECAS